MFFRKQVNDQHIHIMQQGQHEYQQPDIAAEGARKLAQALYLFPCFKFQENITHVKKIVGNQKKVIDTVGGSFVSPVKPENKNPAICVKHFSQPVYDEKHGKGVNNVGCYIEVHDLKNNYCTKLNNNSEISKYIENKIFTPPFIVGGK